MLAYVGLDPGKDVDFEVHASADSIQLLADGKVDAFLGFPPEPQELRAREIGHVVVNSSVDQPWSQYFCCMVAGNKDFVAKHPVATKRALRAILKATDICSSSLTGRPNACGQGGYAKRYDYAPGAEKTSPTASGASTTPRTRCGSTRCACMKSG